MAEKLYKNEERPTKVSLSANYSQTVETARSYYNSTDADRFYATIWGGEDIHIGLYERDTDTIFDASRRTVQTMASMIQDLGPKTRVLDIGSGYGGSARYLVKHYGCHVGCLNLSEIQNQRNRELNKRDGLSLAINVVDGNFEDIPLPDNSVDVVWSQDAILHSGNRQKVLEEVHRVLTQGGQFIFTDPMQSQSCPQDALQPILERIHLDSLGSIQYYKDILLGLGFKEITIVDHSTQLSNHYGRVLQEVLANHLTLVRVCSEEYIERMKTGLQHWVDGGMAGHLTWGILHFQKT